MWTLIITVLLLYMAYGNIRSLVELPFGEWATVQWLVVAVTVALVVTAVFCLWKYWKESKRKKAEAEEKRIAEAAEKAKARKEEMAAEKEALQRETNFDNAARMEDAEGLQIEREMAAIDKYDELEGFELLGIQTVLPSPEEKEKENTEEE